MKNTDIFWKEEILFIIDAFDYKHIWVVNMISFLFCLGIRRVFYFPIFYVVRSFYGRYRQVVVIKKTCL